MKPNHLTFSERNRAAEVLCAVEQINAHTADLPNADDISHAVGYKADEMLAYLCFIKWLKGHGDDGSGMPRWYSVTAKGDAASVRHCRRRAA